MNDPEVLMTAFLGKDVHCYRMRLSEVQRFVPGISLENPLATTAMDSHARCDTCMRYTWSPSEIGHPCGACTGMYVRNQFRWNDSVILTVREYRDTDAAILGVNR